MGDKDLKRDPYQIEGDEDAWWYEDKKGIEIHVKHKCDDGSYRFRDTHFTISWKQIRAALERKDKE